MGIDEVLDTVLHGTRADVGRALDADRQWWTDAVELLRVGSMLGRMGVSVAEFTAKPPWEWSGRRQIGDALERVMRQAGVPPEMGWEMSLVELALRATS
jgi:hypothetical protein